MILDYAVREVSPYISWVYFFHAWGFQPRFAAIANIHDCPSCRTAWVATFPEAERSKAREAAELFQEACKMLEWMEGKVRIGCLFRLFSCHADGDNLLFYRDTSAGESGHSCLLFPLLRQQTPQADGRPYLCLSDFVRPVSHGKSDTVGAFASSVSLMAAGTDDDPYRQLLIQTLSDRLAEAATEKMHEYVRKEAWGYAPDEHLSIAELLCEKFQGIRPAVGYPSLPDQSVNFLLDELLDMKQIGITLTENGAMYPHASVCGLMLAHPQARYFAVGKIAADQLADYSRRRGLPVETMRKFLSANL